MSHFSDDPHRSKARVPGSTPERGPSGPGLSEDHLPSRSLDIARRKPFEPGDYAGKEWVVDAFGCTPDACRSVTTLGRIIEQIVDDLDLHPVRAPIWQTFEGGGVTGMLLLSESHVTCHSFPELGYVAFNLYCCRQRRAWPWDDQLAESLGASRVVVRELIRG